METAAPRGTHRSGRPLMRRGRGPEGGYPHRGSTPTGGRQVPPDDAVGPRAWSTRLVRMKELPVRAARWSALHPWRAIVGWLVFVVLCLGIGSAVGTHSATTEDYRVGEAGRAEAMAAEGHLQRRPTEQVLISARSGALDTAAAGAAARDVAARMARLPEVLAVAPPRTSKDGGTLLVEVTMKGSELDAKKHVDLGEVLRHLVQQGVPDQLMGDEGGPRLVDVIDAVDRRRALGEPGDGDAVDVCHGEGHCHTRGASAMGFLPRSGDRASPRGLVCPVAGSHAGPDRCGGRASRRTLSVRWVRRRTHRRVIAAGRPARTTRSCRAGAARRARWCSMRPRTPGPGVIRGRVRRVG